MHGAQDQPWIVLADSYGTEWAEQERTAGAADQPPCAACAARRGGGLPLRRGVVTLEHWLDLNA